MIADSVAAFNERVKLLANTVNATGIGIVGFGILRPITESLPPPPSVASVRAPPSADELLSQKFRTPVIDPTPPDFGAISESIDKFFAKEAPGLLSQAPMWLYWLLAGVVLHLAAQLILGSIRKAAPNDDV